MNNDKWLKQKKHIYCMNNDKWLKQVARTYVQMLHEQASTDDKAGWILPWRQSRIDQGGDAELKDAEAAMRAAGMHDEADIAAGYKPDLRRPAYPHNDGYAPYQNPNPYGHWDPNWRDTLAPRRERRSPNTGSAGPAGMTPMRGDQ
jgi:hypothetical protein